MTRASRSSSDRTRGRSPSAPVTLNEDEYLMIGDNRDNSKDGRFFGPVHLKQITGEALFIGVSFGDHFLDPNLGPLAEGAGALNGRPR